jgi:hypothetical protein
MTKNVIPAKTARMLRRVVKHILAEPARYDQGIILDKGMPGEVYGLVGILPRAKVQKYPECGIIGCLGGWVATIYGKRQMDNALEFAEQVLGLTYHQAKCLFADAAYAAYGQGWPEEFVERYKEAKTLRQRALVMQERVEYFIKTGE